MTARASQVSHWTSGDATGFTGFNSMGQAFHRLLVDAGHARLPKPWRRQVLHLFGF